MRGCGPARQRYGEGLRSSARAIGPLSQKRAADEGRAEALPAGLGIFLVEGLFLKYN